MWKLGSIFIISAIFLTDVCVFCTICNQHEYLTDQHTCCPMCLPGFYVRKHCEDSRITTCKRCLSSSFTDEPNGLLWCKPCTVCEPNAGLKVKRACNPTSDTVCEPLEGYWCFDPIKDGCRGAVQHSTCSSGQYIKQKGTGSSDTLCETSVSTVSDGSDGSIIRLEEERRDHGIIARFCRNPERVEELSVKLMFIELILMGICGFLYAFAVCGPYTVCLNDGQISGAVVLQLLTLTIFLIFGSFLFFSLDVLLLWSFC